MTSAHVPGGPVQWVLFAPQAPSSLLLVPLALWRCEVDTSQVFPPSAPSPTCYWNYSWSLELWGQRQLPQDSLCTVFLCGDSASGQACQPNCSRGQGRGIANSRSILLEKHKTLS